MEVRGFQPADLAAIKLQLAQLGMRTELDNPDYGAALAAAGPAFTATRLGDVIACIGVIRQWDSYGRAWALLADTAGPCMITLTRQIRRWLRFHNPGRIDTAVDCGIPEAVRWAEMLGLTREGTMRHYSPEGRDCYLYAQVVD